MRSPSWLRRVALAIALLGIVHLLATWPVWSMYQSKLPLEEGLTNLFMFIGTGLWIVASGFVLGFLAEAAKGEEDWAGPFARGVTNFLALGGFLACAMMWSNPAAWALGILSAWARLCARKPVLPVPNLEPPPAK